MNIRSKIASLLLATVLISSCEPQRTDVIPYVFVEIDINLNLTDYLDLRQRYSTAQYADRLEEISRQVRRSLTRNSEEKGGLR